MRLKFWYGLMSISFTCMLLFMSGVDGPAWVLDLLLIAVSLGIMWICQKKIEEYE